MTAAPLGILLLVLSSVPSANVSGAGDDADREGAEFFEVRIRPVLEEHCTRCHGETRQRGHLRLDSYAALRRGGDRGPAVVPGDREGSPLLRALSYADEDFQMPPRGKLPVDLVAEFETWVERGAPGPLRETPGDVPADAAEFPFERRMQHWSFQPLRTVDWPVVKRRSWPVDVLDRFVLARLEAAGLSPAPRAEPAVFLRRVTFDLTGLPPTIEEAEAFLAEGGTPAARERVVDRLLASPAFGERFARHWLDLMRFAETRGHEFDYFIPQAYQYRDYLIRAFRADVPYDQLVMEHVAGDLLPTPRRDPEGGFNESVLGTGFWYVGNEVHSPVDTRLDETERVTDQIDTFSKAFLGLTVACARCHDHKFDPIRAADFYALGGYLLSSSYRQVRFDTLQHNAEVAERIEALDRRVAPEVARIFAATLQPSVQESARILEAVREFLYDARGIDDLTEQERTTFRKKADILHEGFEGETYGDWEVEGTAFGARPIRRDEVEGIVGDVRGRGERVVNSYCGRVTAEGSASDEPTGRLRSPPFRIQQPYLHFLIGGGDHPGQTCVQLLVDEETVREATGSRSNVMTHRVFDLSEFLGQEARLVVVDDHSGSWGQVSLDHVVFSPASDEAALDRALPEGEAVARQRALADAAERHHLTRQQLERWASALAAGRASRSHPLHELGRILARDETQVAAPLPGAEAPDLDPDADPGPLQAAENGSEVVLDYAVAKPGDWIPDGVVFGRGPTRCGQVLLSADPAWPLAGIESLPAASSRPEFAALRVSPGTQAGPGDLNWIQAGRTIRTPSFRLQFPRLYYLVRGSGRAFACVDSHRMVAGPLHLETVLSLGEGEDYRWVVHDLGKHLGRRVHVEFTVPEGGSLSIARVVQADAEPPRVFPLAEKPSVESEARTFAAEACEFAARLGDALAAVAGGNPSTEQAELANWVVQHRELFESGEDRPFAEVPALLAERAAWVAEIRLESRTAPAILDGSGCNEQLLARGNHKTPQGEVPRRFLEALGGCENTPPAVGSGRLELARRMVDPTTNPLLSRVIVNRLWHHVFGRGLVASVDDFGALGSAPTHPELLDYLAGELIRNGWSLKRLIRRLVLSSTYQMSHETTERARALDPKNELWHHREVRRLEAEAIRDTILAVAGSLDPAAFGPSVPIHLTPFMEGRGAPESSGPVDGEGRRSIYLSVRRNFLVPLFSVFDFPNPATCIGRRTTSNVPAQALALLNSSFVTEQAALWARRLLEDSAATPRQRIERMYRTALTRPPTADEAEQALAFLESQRALYAPPDQNDKAWADLAHVLINAKEFLFVR